MIISWIHLINPWYIPSTHDTYHRLMIHLINSWYISSTHDTSHQLMIHLNHSWIISSTHATSHQFMIHLIHSWIISSSHDTSRQLMIHLINSSSWSTQRPRPQDFFQVFRLVHWSLRLLGLSQPWPLRRRGSDVLTWLTRTDKAALTRMDRWTKLHGRTDGRMDGYEFVWVNWFDPTGMERQICFVYFDRKTGMDRKTAVLFWDPSDRPYWFDDVWVFDQAWGWGYQICCEQHVRAGGRVKLQLPSSFLLTRISWNQLRVYWYHVLVDLLLHS